MTVEVPGEKDVFATLYGSPDGALRGAVIVNWPKASITLRRALAARSGIAGATGSIRALRPAVSS